MKAFFNVVVIIVILGVLTLVGVGLLAAWCSARNCFI